jgi:hypothetical protein
MLQGTESKTIHSRLDGQAMNDWAKRADYFERLSSNLTSGSVSVDNNRLALLLDASHALCEYVMTYADHNLLVGEVNLLQIFEEDMDQKELASAMWPLMYIVDQINREQEG